MELKVNVMYIGSNLSERGRLRGMQYIGSISSSSLGHRTSNEREARLRKLLLWPADFGFPKENCFGWGTSKWAHDGCLC